MKLFPLNKSEISWIFYDWANSAFTLMIMTVFFPVFFKDIISINLNPNVSSAYIAYAAAIAGIITAIASPVLGAAADFKNTKKKLFSFFLIAGIIFTVLMAFCPQKYWPVSIILFIIATVFFSSTNIFYDSFLNDITDKNRIHWISSLGYAMGYIGSIIPYIISIIALIIFTGLFKISNNLIIRSLFILCALWWLFFSLPIIKNVKQSNITDNHAFSINAVFSNLFSTIKQLKNYKFIFLFLIAYFFYIDGVDTIIRLAVPYALDLKIISKDDRIMLLIILLLIQIIGFPFTIIYGIIAKKNPDKIIPIILSAIIIYIFIIIFSFFISSIIHIWIIAVLIGMVQGGLQSLSRSYFSLIIPKDKSSLFFGYYNIFGKFAAITGPLIVGLISNIINMRYGMLGIIPLFVSGGIILLYQLKRK